MNIHTCLIYILLETRKEYVTKLQISRDNTKVVAIYSSGKLAILSVPSLQLINEWFMTEQVKHLTQ